MVYKWLTPNENYFNLKCKINETIIVKRDKLCAKDLFQKEKKSSWLFFGDSNQYTNELTNEDHFRNNYFVKNFLIYKLLKLANCSC